MAYITKEFDRLPVGINKAYSHNAQGRRFLSKEAKAWKEEIAWEFKKGKPKKGRFGVEIIIEMGDKRKRDVDSGIKFILDSLTGIIWADDSEVEEIHVFKSSGHKEHKTIISVFEL